MLSSELFCKETNAVLFLQIKKKTEPQNLYVNC